MGTTGQSITLANSIIGVGILAMPFCFQQCGVLLASLILLSMGLVSRLCCYYLLKSALIARRRTFEFLAFHVFGPTGKCVVEIGIIGFLMGTCIAYFVVVGDLGPQIVSKMFNINQSDILRTSIMVIVSLVCVLPLGLLRNVDSLSNVSAATICFYFCLVLKVILEAASQLFSGSNEWTNRVVLWRPAGLLQCVPILSMALFCQTQLFEIFDSMPTLSLEKMTVVSKNAINICTAVYFTLGLFGYIAFNDHEISGNILISLSPTMASDVIKLGFVMSVAFSFPLIIFPCRASLYSFLYKKVHSSHHDHIINHSIPETSFRCITVTIIGASLFISLLIPNIELVLGLVGSTIGVLICVVFPAACFVNVTIKNTNERILAKAIVILGLVIMVLGTYANLEAAENKHDRYDETKITQERIDQIVEDFFQKMEKSEGGKSAQAIEVISKEQVKNNGFGDAEKDSEVQPPNPIPPDPSNEKINIEKPAQEKDTKPKDKMILTDQNNEYDKVSETHPKNLKKHNGVRINKDAEIKAEIEKPEEIIKSVPEVEARKDIIKQQQLIETIKQHGEEQKELLKEQKELLDEIIKTKNEIEQNKQEADNIEAKKIAVESIQKIADIAIKSLSGVTDKPIAAKEEPLEKVANKAVQEIAKKAVETIEAIKEIKENPIEKAAIQDTHALGQANVANSDSVKNVVKSNQNGLNLQPILNALPAVYKQQQENIKQNSVQGLANSNAQLLNTNIQPQQQQPQAQQFTNQQQEVDNIQKQQQSVNIQQQNKVNVQQQAVNIQQPDNFQQPLQSDNQLVVNNQKHANSQPNVEIQNPFNMQQANSEHAHQDSRHNANMQQNANKLTVAQNSQQAPNPQPQYQNNDAQIRHNRDIKNDAIVINENVPVQNDDGQNGKQKAHSHSPDEPQSYKEGEDFVLEKHKNIAQNVPIPLAMNGNVNGKWQVEKENPRNIKESESKIQNEENNQLSQQDSSKVRRNTNYLENNGAHAIDNYVEKGNNIYSEAQIRHKREVVDCTETNSLKPEDKEICNHLINKPKVVNDKQTILQSDFDLGNLELPKNIPMHETMIHHVRSLKSLPENKKR